MLINGALTGYKNPLLTMSHTSAASSAVLAATTSFRWVDLLEKEFDKVGIYYLDYIYTQYGL